jgi:hypothetical protein
MLGVGVAVAAPLCVGDGVGVAVAAAVCVDAGEGAVPEGAGPGAPPPPEHAANATIVAIATDQAATSRRVTEARTRS